MFNFTGKDKPSEEAPTPKKKPSGLAALLAKAKAQQKKKQGDETIQQGVMGLSEKEAKEDVINLMEAYQLVTAALVLLLHHADKGAPVNPVIINSAKSIGRFAIEKHINHLNVGKENRDD